jgi:hypothetical protein
MKRILVILLATMALPAGAGAQRGDSEPRSTLPAFRSDAELARFVAEHAAARERRLAERRARMAAVRDSIAAARGAGTCPAGNTVTRAGAPGDSALPAVIRGQVLAAASDQPVASATVQVEGSAIRAVTGADGSFRVAVPPERLTGPLTVSASGLGFARAARTLSPAPGDSVWTCFHLAPSTLALEGVVASATGESVTNVQHEGVDEGGIVKVHGEHLVVLRRGRLFTVRIGARDLRPASAVDAYGPGIDPEDAWYDEMLVSGDVVIVIGYSHGGGGTEVGLFRIDAAGRLRHSSTYHLRSNDYSSSHNYASRLVEGKLVFYTPLFIGPGEEDSLSAWVPALRRWHPGAGEGGFRSIASARRIHRPARALDPDVGLALHTVTSCDVARGELDCAATGVLGPAGHAFYVSPRSVFVWTTGWGRSGEKDTPAIVYRIPLDGAAPSALGAAGSPIDQFSFLESADGHLNVLVRAGGAGQWMTGAEWMGGGMALLRVPLARFGDGSADAPEPAYTPLPAPGYGAVQNRFVGRHLLYGVGSGWESSTDRSDAALHVVEWATGRVRRLALPHGVDRIEAMGPGAVIVGADTADLHFTAVRLSTRPALAGRYTLPGASQGETRSHGFFYRPDGEETGVLGLPVRGPGASGYEHLFEESASILFLRNRSLELDELGALAARAEGTADDGCRASCVDWYGNARPLFLRGRVFALLGYELVEGAVRGGRIREIRRSAFAPRVAEASAGN